MVRLPPLERLGPHGPIRLERTVKLLPVGAISITVRVPFSVNSLDELVGFHDLRFNDGSYLYDEVRQLAEDVRRELQALLRPPGRTARRRGGVHRLLHQRPARAATDGVDVAGRGLAPRQPPRRRRAADRGARPAPPLRPGGRGVDRQVFQLLRARPGRHRLGRRRHRRRAALLRRSPLHHGAGQPAARRAGGVRPHPRRRRRPLLPRPRRRLAASAARPTRSSSASCAKSASTSPA